MDQIEHFIVLMLENRSFDHMLGYLEHPDDTFDGVGKLANPPHATTRDARYAIYPGPDHSHMGVL
jgi:phospholipase C